MKLTAWIMFESHNFLQVKGDGVDGLKKALEDAYEEEYQFGETPNHRIRKGTECIAGWGRVTLDGVASEKFCVFEGLHKREEIKNIQKDLLEEALEKESEKWNKFINEKNLFLNKIKEALGE